MIPIRTQLEQERKRLGVLWSVLEQDYFLSWVLHGLSQVPELKEGLVFKGGTALKKMYFGDYRFSEDLDFTARPSFLSSEDLFRCIGMACQKVCEGMTQHMPTPHIECAVYQEKTPHPFKQDAFTIRGQFYWHRSPLVRVQLEITRAEKIYDDTPLRDVIYPYQHDNPYACALHTYTLEEIVSEKFRAILQSIRYRSERGWSRSRVRDFYDLWCIFTQYRDSLHFDKIKHIFPKKCQDKEIHYQGISDFFQETHLMYARKEWQQWLNPLVHALPDFDQVMSDLKIFLEKEDF